MNQQIPTADLRAIEILGRVKGVFAAKGFDGASMQDLARAAGLSAGNLYRYFPSKNAIIEALVALDLDQIEAEFRTIMQAPSPREALRAVIRNRLESTGEEEAALWAEIEAAAARRSEIAAINARMETEVARYLTLVFARIAGLSEAEARARFEAHAYLMILLLKGASVQACPSPGRPRTPSTPELRALVLRMIDELLTEIAGQGPAAADV